MEVLVRRCGLHGHDVSLRRACFLHALALISVWLAGAVSVVRGKLQGQWARECRLGRQEQAGVVLRATVGPVGTKGEVMAYPSEPGKGVGCRYRVVGKA